MIDPFCDCKRAIRAIVCTAKIIADKAQLRKGRKQKQKENKQIVFRQLRRGRLGAEETMLTEQEKTDERQPKKQKCDKGKMQRD
jgi:hypothetical protein